VPSNSDIVVVTFLIKTIPQWPPLYALRSCSYFILKLLQKTRTFWSNSPFPFTINNFSSPLLSPYSPYTNDDESNVSRPPILNKTSEFCNGIHVKKH
jgi:hypothetical protein